MGDVAIKVDGLSKRYRIGHRDGGRGLLSRLWSTEADFLWALKDVSFEVRRGESLGIIGRNGAGKSTLLKILSQITDPTEGRAEVRGRIGSLLEVGTGFHPELTGRENVFLSAAILGMRRAEVGRRFDEIAAFADIDRFLDTPIKYYSSGMYMRLAFAVAAHLDSEILLIDEVLAVGDVEFQKRCLGKMGTITKSGRTILFVSHNMFSMQHLCAKAILLRSGRVAKEGSTAETIAEYLGEGRSHTGEVAWATPETAPGDERARLKAVRVIGEDGMRGAVDIARPFRIEVDYWNLKAGGRRMVSIHLTNALGVMVLSSVNMPSASTTPDLWFDRPYPEGEYRTTCVVPGELLNDGEHTVSVFIVGSNVADGMVTERDVLTFHVTDTGAARKEHAGEWLGAVRPRLGWSTDQLQ